MGDLDGTGKGSEWMIPVNRRIWHLACISDDLIFLFVVFPDETFFFILLQRRSSCCNLAHQIPELSTVSATGVDLP